jgi:uncharacterized membrane protein
VLKYGLTSCHSRWFQACQIEEKTCGPGRHQPDASPTKPARAIAGLTTCLRLAAGVLSVGVALVSYRYVARVGPIPPNIAQNRFFLPWIILHAGAAATALLCGPVQLLMPQQRHRPVVHRWLGRVYVAGCLVGGGSGLVLAAGVSTGTATQAGFACLAVLWITVTLRGWCSARARRWADHERWMVRSFALTFAAVTLRLYLPIALGFGFEFGSAYRAIAWLCWVPNAIAAEFYLKRQRSS